jgi:SAM-dependent methyltransferase
MCIEGLGVSINEIIKRSYLRQTRNQEYYQTRPMVDKDFFKTARELRIDLGCGNSKKEGFTGIDVNFYPGVDFVANLDEGLGFIPDNAVDECYSAHFMEHILNFEFMMQEIHRTIKPGGIIEIAVPHFSNPYFYSDFTHRRFFGLYSFSYFSSSQKGQRRKVPFYNFPFEFEVVSKKLVFRSALNPVLNLWRKYIVQTVFNAFPLIQEIYEGMFSKCIPCYEVRFLLKAVK